MNINKITNGLDSTSRARNDAERKLSSSQTRTTEVNERDDVRLSSNTRSIQQIEAEIRNMSDVDDATVDRIRAALQNGEYKIDYEKLAGKMLDFEERLN